MLTIKVLYFAHLVDRTGVREETVALSGNSIRDLKSELVSRHAKLQDSLDACRVAIDEEFAVSDSALSEGQTVAFIPPVSGG